MQPEKPIEVPANFPVQLAPIALVDVNKILAGLGYLPHRDVDALAKHIKAQGDAQVDAYIKANAPKAPEAETNPAVPSEQ